MDDFLPLLIAHRDRCLKDEPALFVSMSSNQGARRTASCCTRCTQMMPSSRCIGTVRMSPI